jgi:hypothetical protein
MKHVVIVKLEMNDRYFKTTRLAQQEPAFTFPAYLPVRTSKAAAHQQLNLLLWLLNFFNFFHFFHVPFLDTFD